MIVTVADPVVIPILNLRKSRYRKAERTKLCTYNFFCGFLNLRLIDEN